MSSPMSSPLSAAPWVPSVDGHRPPAVYTNVFRASGSSEELILDFGLDAHRRTGEDSEPMVLIQRLVLTWGQTKRLAAMLRDLVQRHEQSYGPIPLDPANRPPNSPSSPRT